MPGSRKEDSPGREYIGGAGAACTGNGIEATQNAERASCTGGLSATDYARDGGSCPPCFDTHRFYKRERWNNDERAETRSISGLHDDRGDTRVCGRLDAGRTSRSGDLPPALPPAGNRRLVRPRGQRGRGFVPGADRSAGACAARGRDSASDAEELAQVNDALRKFIAADTSATKPLLKKFESLLLLQPPRLNVAATFTQTAQRRGRGTKDSSRRRSRRQHRSAAARRLDHRLVGAGRRQQGDVRQVLRRHPDRELRDRRRHDAGRAVGPAATAKARDSSRRRSC